VPFFCQRFGNLCPIKDIRRVIPKWAVRLSHSEFTELVPEYASRQDEIGGRGLPPLRMVIFTKGSSDVLDHAASEIVNGSKLGRGSRKNMPGEGF